MTSPLVRDKDWSSTCMEEESVHDSWRRKRRRRRTTMVVVGSYSDMFTADGSGWSSDSSANGRTSTLSFLPSRHFGILILLLLFPGYSAWTNPIVTPSARISSLSIRTLRRLPNFVINGHALHSSSFDDEDDDDDERSSTLKHIAFICDGNSRWAQQRNLPSLAGHAAGAERLVEILQVLQRQTNVVYCTMYAFSTENWKRPSHEIKDILQVMEQTARQFRHRLRKDGVRFRVLGDLTDSRIPESLRNLLQQMQDETSIPKDDNNKEGLTLCVAVNYGGRQDIVNAAKRIATLAVAETLSTQNSTTSAFSVDDINDDLVSSLLSTSGIPDPDLIIRTSGESRLSNFLLWNAAYSELYFSDTLWPDFDKESLQEAVAWYHGRQRRFGARTKSTKETSVSSSVK